MRFSSAVATASPLSGWPNGILSICTKLIIINITNYVRLAHTTDIYVYTISTLNISSSSLVLTSIYLSFINLSMATMSPFLAATNS